MLDFNRLLEMVDLDPAETLIVRHVPVEASLKRVLPWLVSERPNLWLAYQQIQWRTLEKAMTRGRHIASFIALEGSTATLAGIYRIGAWQELDFEGYRTFPGNRELEELGMTGRTAEMGTCLAFDLEPLPHYSDWIGRLSISWPQPYQQWWRWAGRGRFPVAAIESESRFVQRMPEWREIVLGWAELHSLPTSWKTAHAQWRGVYFIFDAARQAGYVGSATGSENILGRWTDYARSGHGGNRRLVASNPADLRFSILECTSPDLAPESVLQLEASWKDRLHTRQYGLNAN